MNVKNKVTFSTYFIYFLIVAVFVTIRLLSGFGVLSGLPNAWSVVINVGIQLIMFAFPVLLFSIINKQKAGQTLKFFEYKKISAKAWLIALLAGFVVYFLNLYVASFFDNIIGLFGYRFSSSGSSNGTLSVGWLLLNIVTTAILPAICEETAHRGMLLKGSSAMGYGRAIFLSAILFGLLHMNIEQFFYATILGALMGYVTVLSDSIFPAMCIHFMNNFMGVYLSFSMSNKLPLGRGFATVLTYLESGGILGNLFIWIFLIFLVMTLHTLLKKLFKETAGRAYDTLQRELMKDFIKRDYLGDVSSSRNEVRGEKSEEIEIDTEELVANTNISLGLMTDLDRKILNGKRYKADKWTILFVTLATILTAVCTIFTFIWGIL